MDEDENDKISNSTFKGLDKVKNDNFNYDEENEEQSSMKKSSTTP